jgi:hypothetical protein
MQFIISEGGVGDVIALTATVREFHKQRPFEEIYVSTGGRHDAVFENNPHVTPKPKGGAAVMVEMEVNNDRGNLAVSFGIQAGIHVTDHTPELWLTQEERSTCPIGYEGGRRVIVIDPWSRCISRRWKWDRWAEVVAELRKKYLVVTGGKRVPDHVSRNVDDRLLDGELDLTDALTLREQAVLLERADLFLGMDSGGVHLAAAVGCPQVAIYSRSNWYSRSYWNTTPVFNALHPCVPEFCNRTCGNPQGFCLDGIHPGQVLDAVELALMRFPRGQKAHSGIGQAPGRQAPRVGIPGTSRGGLRGHDDDGAELDRHVQSTRVGLPARFDRPPARASGDGPATPGNGTAAGG